MSMSQDNLKRVMRFLDERMEFENLPPGTDKHTALMLKLAALERAIDAIRLHHEVQGRGNLTCPPSPGCLEVRSRSPISFDEFLLCHWNEPEKPNSPRGHGRFHLAFPLLKFIFKNRDKRWSVHSMTRAFIRENHERWTPFDLARTSTGAVRLETNIKMAAHHLRRYGLLLFTKDEAFKRWRLSVLGIVVADRIPDEIMWFDKQGNDSWEWNFLGNAIWVIADVQNVPDIIESLERYAKLEVEGFWDERQAFLTTTMKTIDQYQRLPQMPRQQRNRYINEVRAMFYKLALSKESVELAQVLCRGAK
ncbi:hypothetical protein [Sulfuriroseicoccus oceanibius]|uniref:Uncharacterized protein n=1 Tax=Sulfuriroseicoccus oceanibius TaxID=2707525 RepID=A0A7T7F214_9BACT|nr:hypothetical protein [Sulfuriroseicoccus oceanibius]QQL45336.1 hypothetical protein G3M56_001735 [Sulfuriroseicoccus oceanibius]